MHKNITIHFLIKFLIHKDVDCQRVGSALIPNGLRKKKVILNGGSCGSEGPTIGRFSLIGWFFIYQNEIKPSLTYVAILCEMCFYNGRSVSYEYLVEYSER